MLKHLRFGHLRNIGEMNRDLRPKKRGRRAILRDLTSQFLIGDSPNLIFQETPTHHRLQPWDVPKNALLPPPGRGNGVFSKR